MGYFACEKSEKSRKRNKNKINLIYEPFGTAEENQEKIDRVFDLIFEDVMKRREQKQGY